MTGTLSDKECVQSAITKGERSNEMKSSKKNECKFISYCLTFQSNGQKKKTEK